MPSKNLPDIDPYFSLPTEDEFSDEPDDGTPYDVGYDPTTD